MHDVLEVRAGLELLGEMPRLGIGLHRHHRLRGDIGHGQGVGVLVYGERPGSVTVEVEGAETDGTDPRGETEDGPHAGIEGRPGEGEPARGGRLRQVGLQYGPVLQPGSIVRPC